jgi:hypothetical protein
MKSTTILLFSITLGLSRGVGFVAAAGPDGTATVPAWVTESRPTRPEDIPDADYAFLRDWIDRNARPADDYLVGLFKRHDVVIFGEAHNIREHKLLIIDVIPRLYREAGVRCIGWEFSTPLNDAELEKLTMSPKPDPEAQLDYARAFGSHAWDSREHWDLIEAVRKLNAGLPPGAERMRFVGIDKPIDWVDVYTKLKTKPKDSPEMKALYGEVELKRDVEMAENAERETLAKGVKALLFVGRGHDETHFGLPPDKPYRRPIMGQVLHKKYGDRVFQVMADWGKFAPMNKAMESRDRMPIGYDMYSSPFEAVLMVDMVPTPTKMANLARGYVYFGPVERLHRNTTIPGFVTDAMFEKYKEYYRIDFGRPFQSAKEVDDHFMENLWGGVGR